MITDWFDSTKAAEIGAELAREFLSTALSSTGSREGAPSREDLGQAVEALLRRADRDVRALRLNFFKKARFANSFKWQLLENGVELGVADAVTQRLVMHLSVATPIETERPALEVIATNTQTSNENKLLNAATKHVKGGEYAEATSIYEDLLAINPRHVIALNNLGSMLCKVGRYHEAEQHFRQAIKIRPDYPDAHNNLGTVLRWQGHVHEAEIVLRRALKLKPTYTDARYNLGFTLILLGRLRDARGRFEKILKASPRHAEALFGMGQVARIEGRFEDAQSLFKSVLDASPHMPGAWAALASIRKMTKADSEWLENAVRIADSDIAPLEAADIHFAIGKYFDDIEDFEKAFRNYRRANDLQKTVADDYNRDARKKFVDRMISTYTRECLARPESGSNVDARPIFLIGMMRSGTSLTEQILASHPAIKGAGELGFWSSHDEKHNTVVLPGPSGASLRQKLASDYLHEIAQHSAGATHVIDKTPVDSDYLGTILSVFPRARIIYMQRNPIDTCLSCYFQQFSPSLNFSMDLSDLNHYYHQHQRLMDHWRSVLPKATIFDLPYAGLVADQLGWTKKMLAFLGLEWDDHCLDFYKNKRPVVTASYWQVRQRIYTGSVDRWQNYRKFIGPLLNLKG